MEWNGFFPPNFCLSPNQEDSQWLCLAIGQCLSLELTVGVTVVTLKLTLKLCQVEPIAVLSASFTWSVFNGSPKMSASAK